MGAEARAVGILTVTRSATERFFGNQVGMAGISHGRYFLIARILGVLSRCVVPGWLTASCATLRLSRFLTKSTRAADDLKFLTQTDLTVVSPGFRHPHPMG